MAYEQLPIVDVPVSELRLDLANYRLDSRPDDEAAALRFLLAAEEVLDAATMILRDGYFDNEVPIVVKETDETGREIKVVLEGNRRVSALKVLLEPSLVPEYEVEISRLLKRHAVEAEDLPDNIRVIVAPSRETALPHISRLHTTTPKRPWNLDQQANFYYSLINNEVTVEDLKSQFPGIKIKRFMQMAEMRSFIRNVPLSDSALASYVAGADLKMSSFEYAYTKKEITELMGVSFESGTGLLVPSKWGAKRIAQDTTPAQRRVIERVLSGFKSGELSTRSTKLKPRNNDYFDFIDELRAIHAGEPFRPTDPTPDPSPTPPQCDPPPSPGDDEETHLPPEDPAPSPDDPGSNGERGPNRPDTRDILGLQGLLYEHAPVNLRNRYHELRTMRLNTQPVATVLLLRTILECTIKVHFEIGDNRRPHQLKDSVSRLKEAYGEERQLNPLIEKIYSGQPNQPGSVAWFNMVAHNPDASPTHSEIHQSWRLISPILRFILARPAAGQGS